MTSQRVRSVRIGGGSAAAEDWIDPAVELAEKGDLDYLCFDSLSESELSIVALRRLTEPDAVGYDAFLDARMRAVLPACARNGVKIVGNMGSGDPVGARDKVVEILAELGITGLTVAAVTGDDLVGRIADMGLSTDEEGLEVAGFGDRLISAHAYAPIDAAVEALAAGADIVLTGRVGDGALFLAPLMHEFGWAADDWDHKAQGIVVGHLLECAGQLTGGYFADPPYKSVPDLHRIGFPIAEVLADGRVELSKVEGSGGLLDTRTCAEQMLYETTDPQNYLYADVVVDFSDVAFEQIGPNHVRLAGEVRGKPAPQTLKVALGVREGFLAQSMVFYGGPGGFERARIAEGLLRRRLEHLKITPRKLRIDLLGVNALYGDVPAVDPTGMAEVGLRVAAHCDGYDEAVVVCREGSNNLSNNGPAAVSCRQRQIDVREVIGFHSTYVDRSVITPAYSIAEAVR